MRCARPVSGDDEPPWIGIDVQLCLDGIEQFGNVLELVDEHRTACHILHEQRWIRSHGVACGQVVQVDDLPMVGTGDLAEQCRLSHGARSLEDHNWFLRHSGRYGRRQPAWNDLDKPRCHG